MADTVAIVGLRDFSRKLRAVDNDAAKQLRVVFNEAASIVVEGARKEIPKRTGRAAGSLKLRSTRTAVRVAFGGDRAPYYPWLDFGGRVGPQDSVVRPFLKDGRYVYPAYYAHRADVQRAMEDGIARVCRAAGLEMD